MMGAMTAFELTTKRVRELVMANRAIRSPAYRADRKGIAWGADVISALMDLWRVEKDPRPDHPDGWVGFAVLPAGYEPEFAKGWRGDAFRLEFDVVPGPSVEDAILVLQALSTLEGAGSVDDDLLGTVELPDPPSTDAAWRERAQSYQAARRADDDHQPAAVAAFIGALPGWKREVATRIDRIIEREVPDVRRAVKWHAPFYGVEGQGWFASISPLSKAIKLTFTRGTALDPMPPGGTRDDSRWLDLDSVDALDEDQLAAWVRQAAALPGWGA